MKFCLRGTSTEAIPQALRFAGTQLFLWVKTLRKELHLHQMRSTLFLWSDVENSVVQQQLIAIDSTRRIHASVPLAPLAATANAPLVAQQPGGSSKIMWSVVISQDPVAYCWGK